MIVPDFRSPYSKMDPQHKLIMHLPLARLQLSISNFAPEVVIVVSRFADGQRSKCHRRGRSIRESCTSSPTPRPKRAKCILFRPCLPMGRSACTSELYTLFGIEGTVAFMAVNKSIAGSSAARVLMTKFRGPPASF